MKEEFLDNTANGDMAQMPTSTEDRPNRKAFSDRFKKRHADIDFEDKEARYAALNDDDDLMASYEKNGKALSDAFDRSPWAAAMFMDMKDNPDLDPFTWMASQGIDIQSALDDPEQAKKIGEAVKKHQETVAEQKKHEEEIVKNLRESADNMEDLGLSDDEKNELWQKVFAVIAEAEDGIVSTDTWKLFNNGYNYDNAVSSAREEGAMRGRNEKIQNKVKKSQTSNTLPPSLPTSGAESTPQPKQKSGGFFEGLTY